jgi:hypothetical protein
MCLNESSILYQTEYCPLLILFIEKFHKSHYVSDVEKKAGSSLLAVIEVRRV